MTGESGRRLFRSKDSELPIVCTWGAYSGSFRNVETAFLPGDKELWEDSERERLQRRYSSMVQHMTAGVTCQACSVDMPTEALSFFDDDGDTFAVCLDTDSCQARLDGNRAKPGTTSFIMQALNALTTRVDDLEHALSVLPDALAPPWADDAPVDPLDDVERPSVETVTAVMSEIGIPGISLVHGDARAIPMHDESVDLVVTSPPYWAQRSYQDDGTHYDGQIGAEENWGQYVQAMVECTRDWMRVLKPGGSIWVNLGDKYDDRKSLVGLPWRYALACIDQLGLILRAEVVWSKPNGMPESVTDRVRRSHEQFFHFTKQPRYYSAVDHVRDDYAPGTAKRYSTGYGPTARGLAGAVSSAAVRSTAAGDGGPTETNPLGKLPSSVWEIPTQPLVVPPELGVDHYAAFPMEWPRRIIQGWCPAGVCTVCGEGRRPVKSVRREGGRIRKQADTRFLGRPGSENDQPGGQDAPGAHAGYSTVHTIAGEACACTPYTDHPGVYVGVEARAGEALVPGNTPRSIGAPAQGPWREYHLDDWLPPPTRPGVVLDPFGGTGTTALVADMLGRHAVHVDLSRDYLRIAAWRTADPAQRAAALMVPKPPVPMRGQLDLFGEES